MTATATMTATVETKPRPVQRVPRRRAPEEIADAHAWANSIRESDPRFGGQTCGDQADVYQSAFRIKTGLPPVHVCVLRWKARDQLSPAAGRLDGPEHVEAERGGLDRPELVGAERGDIDQAERVEDVR